MLDTLQLDNTALWWLITFSITSFIGTLILVPVFIIRIPHDYFADIHRHGWDPWGHRHPVIRWSFIIGKNLIGVLFIALGIAMLVLPGQGILTMLIGIMLTNFPGKYQLERSVVTAAPVLRNINKLRRRAGREPLDV